MYKTKINPAEKPPKRANPISAFICSQKIPKIVVAILFYLFLCCGGWYAMRENLAYFSLSYGFSSMLNSIVCNDIFAFFAAGLVPLAFFEIISTTCGASLNRLGLPGANMKYTLKIFYGIANLLYGAFTFTYFAFPFLGFFGNLIIRFLFGAISFALFIWFAAVHYVPKPFIGRTIYLVCGTYLIINLIYAVYLIIAQVI